MIKRLILPLLLFVGMFSSGALGFVQYNVNPDINSTVQGYYVATYCPIDFIDIGSCPNSTSVADNMSVLYNSVNSSLEILDYNFNDSQSIEVLVSPLPLDIFSWTKVYSPPSNRSFHVGRDKDVIVYIDYSINYTSGVYPSYPSFYLNVIGGGISETRALNVTIGRHEEYIVIPAEDSDVYLTNILASFRWQRVFNQTRSLMIHRFSVYTFDDEVSATDLSDAYFRTLCPAVGAITDPFTTVFTVGSANVKYKEGAYKSDGNLTSNVVCGATLVNDTIKVRRVIDPWGTLFDCDDGSSNFHEFRYAYSRSFFDYDHYWCATGGACSFNSYRTYGVLSEVNSNDWIGTAKGFVNGIVSNNVPAGKGKNFWIEWFVSGKYNWSHVENTTNNVIKNITSIFGTVNGDSFRLDSPEFPYGFCTENLPSQYFDNFNDECVVDTYCTGGSQYYRDESCTLTLVKNCGACGCLNADVCKVGTYRIFCDGYNMVTENSSCSVLSSNFCTHGCNSTLARCNDDPFTGQQEIFCTTDAECDPYCADSAGGSQHYRFYAGTCSGGTCVYSQENCEYGCNPLSLMCSGVPITDTFVSWLGMVLGISDSATKFLIFVIIDLLTATGIVYAVNRMSGGFGGGLGLGVIFGLVTIIWLVFFTQIGWIAPVVFVLLFILCGMITAWTMLKMFGG